MATKVKGTITRLVTDEGGERIFIEPESAEVLRQLDGSQFLASGEIPVMAAHEGHKIGDEIEVEI